MCSMLTLDNGLGVLLISDREDLNGPSDGQSDEHLSDKPMVASDDSSNQNRSRLNRIEAAEVFSEQMTMQVIRLFFFQLVAVLVPW